MAPSRDSGAPLTALRLYPLLTLLLTGFVKCQSNFTEHLFNLTGLSKHTAAVNGTSLNLTLLDSELNPVEMDYNSTVVTEDAEEFQDWEDELRPGQCHEELLRQLSHYCDHEFDMKMMSVSQEKWCSLEDVIRPYHEMTVCLEMSSNAVGCFYPNPIIQDQFLQVHARFFQTCSKEEPDFTDPPSAVVLTLTLLPVSLIPVLVFLAVRKNQAQK